jgi:hypothetical protein
MPRAIPKVHASIMNNEQLKDRELLNAMRASWELRRRKTQVAAGIEFGVTIAGDGHIVGVWSFHDGTYQLRKLASWQPVNVVSLIEEAIAATCLLLDGKSG